MLLKAKKTFLRFIKEEKVDLSISDKFKTNQLQVTETVKINFLAT